MPDKNDFVIKVTQEDLAAVDAAPSPATAVAPAAETSQGGKSYGNINTAAAETEPALAEERPSFLLQGWFYLGAAGLIGAVAGWGMCEPGFIDSAEGSRWGN